MNTIITPNGNEMVEADNDRLYLIDKAILEMGDKMEHINNIELKSPKARAARRDAQAMFHNTRNFLQTMHDAEYKKAVIKRAK